MPAVMLLLPASQLLEHHALPNWTSHLRLGMFPRLTSIKLRNLCARTVYTCVIFILVQSRCDE